MTSCLDEGTHRALCLHSSHPSTPVSRRLCDAPCYPASLWVFDPSSSSEQLSAPAGLLVDSRGGVSVTALVCGLDPLSSRTFPALLAVTFGGLVLGAQASRGLLLQLGHPPGQPGAQGARSTSVLTASLHLHGETTNY